MYGLDNPSGISVMPAIAPAASTSPLWFTEGGAGQSVSYPGQDWFNMFQAEHLNVLADAGITPVKSDLTQLSKAIKKLISTGNEGFIKSTDKNVQFPDNVGVRNLEVHPRGTVPSEGGQIDFFDKSDVLAASLDIDANGNFRIINATHGAIIYVNRTTGEVSLNKNTSVTGTLSASSNITSINGHIIATNGNIACNNGNLYAGTGIASGADISAAGNIFATRNLYAGAAMLGIDGNITGSLWGSNIYAWLAERDLIGIPLPYPLTGLPTGYLKCNGASFSTSTYPRLAAKYPTGVLPDLRGEYLRGWDDGRGVDSGRAILSAQASTKIETVLDSIPGRTAFSITDAEDAVTGANNAVGQVSYSGNSARTSQRVRVRNIAFNYIVRAI